MSKTKREDLGKGIRALLGDITEETNQQESTVNTDGPKASLTGGTAFISLDDIEVNPFQPRANFDEQALNDLSGSIKLHGVIQPITVRVLEPGKYQLISGERRLRASKMAGQSQIPAYVRQSDDQEMLEIALIENIQREDLNAIEISINYKRLMDECELTQEELSERVGKNRSTVTNYLRLLKLPPDIQKGIKEKKLTMGHARALITIEESEVQLDIFKSILRGDLSVRQVEQLIRKYKLGRKQQTKPDAKIPLAYQRIQDELSSLYSTKVSIKTFKGEKGEITLSYFSDDDLNRILDQLTEK